MLDAERPRQQTFICQGFRCRSGFLQYYLGRIEIAHVIKYAIIIKAVYLRCSLRP